MPRARIRLLAALLASAAALLPPAASAETIFGALSKAYDFNSQLNSARAGVRVTDEDVAIAKSGYRPTIAGVADADYASRTERQDDVGSRIATFAFGVQINQTLFDGFQTRNNVRSAEASVYAAQENLRNTEQNILFNAASAYMDVIRDRRIAALTEQNLAFLSEQVRAARSRLEVGEGTRTDVAQAEASAAQAEANLAAARAQAQASAATYRQIVGTEPGNLEGASPLGKLLPRSLEQGQAIALEQHPAIQATEFLVDASAYQVKSAEGALLPQVSASAGLQRSFTNTITSSPQVTSPGAFPGLPGVTTGGRDEESDTTDTASIGVTLNVPIYQGGRASAQVRQAKERLGQARIEVDVARDQVRQALTTAWTQYFASIEAVQANREVVAAAQLALSGVIEERNVGQRTTLDVLEAQADVITAQINLASAQRDVVVASYAIASATGALTAERLGLDVVVHNPDEHFDAVKDKWYGLRTPDGRCSDLLPC